MKKLLVLTGFVVIIAAGWVMGMSYLNTRTTTTQVHIHHSVDEVQIFQVGLPDEPIIRIQTHGQDTLRAVELKTAQTFSPFVQSPPARYYFEIVAGTQITRGSFFCCETGLHPENGSLVVEGPSEWNYAGYSMAMLP